MNHDSMILIFILAGVVSSGLAGWISFRRRQKIKGKRKLEFIAHLSKYDEQQ